MKTLIEIALILLLSSICYMAGKESSNIEYVQINKYKNDYEYFRLSLRPEFCNNNTCYIDYELLKSYIKSTGLIEDFK